MAYRQIYGRSAMTDETGNVKRPNAKYKLSKGNNADNYQKEGLSFYYNRERRLSKAPQTVKDLYKVRKFNRFNLLQPLVADKPRALVFSSIIILCAAIIMLSILGYFNKTYKLERNKLEISGTVFEGTTIMVIKKTVDSKLQSYTGSVDIAVSPSAGKDEQYPVFYHRIFFSHEPEENYQFTIPYDSTELLLVLQTEKSSLKIKIKPE
jgi:hypothetical protein